MWRIGQDLTGSLVAAAAFTVERASLPQASG